MAKRRLSKNQSRRVQQHQSASLARAKREDQVDESLLGPEQMGTVIAHFGTQVEVECSTTGDCQRCHLRANLAGLVTGDKVVWRSGPTLGVVVSIEARRSELLRPDSYGNMRAVAANIDLILVTIAPEPEPHHNLIDRYLVMAEINRIKPVILLNKIDLLSADNREKIAELTALYGKLGYQVCEVSAKQRDGLQALKALLVDKTSIFVGQSGVGKSSLVQRLLPQTQIKIGDLSTSVGKGRHTTTHSQLFHFPDGGHCIDSPGIREFGLWHLDAEQVVAGFVDMRALAGRCRFRNCKHQHEPGCAILAALATGDIERARFDSYRRIVASLDDVVVKTQNP